MKGTKISYPNLWGIEDLGICGASFNKDGSSQFYKNSRVTRLMKKNGLMIYCEGGRLFLHGHLKIVESDKSFFDALLTMRRSVRCGISYSIK